MPFFSWNCLTLSITGREIDLVVKDDKEMQYLLTFLIYAMKTIDGKKNSGAKLLDLLNS